MAADRRYWDSNAFLGYLNNEPDKADKCEAVLSAAEEGKIDIVTSALTLTEVIKKKGEKPIPRDREQKIKDFFEHPWIIVREVDRFVAEQARDLIWQHGGALSSPDAIQLATALGLKLSVMDTFDDDLIKLSGKIGNPRLVIGHPNVPHTPDFFPAEKLDAVKAHGKNRKKK
jgi:predicted nucleic acid-binding protein